jgi:hypothetical protein
MTELQSLVDTKLKDKDISLQNITCDTLTVKNPSDSAIVNYGGIRQGDYVSQERGYAITKDGNADFRYLYVDELHAKAFIADLEQALAGSQLICKSVAKLHVAFTLPTAGNTGILSVEEFAGFTGHVFADNDIVRLRQFTRSSNTTVTVSDAWGTVAFRRRSRTSTTGAYQWYQEYVFTRSSGGKEGTGTGVVAVGTLVLDYGTTGQGYYEVTTIDGANGANSPYAQIVTWATHPYDGCTVKARMGNLAGITSATWGALSGFGFYGDNVYLEGDCYVKGNITFTNQGSISISGFNNDAGYITGASAPQSFYGATEPTVGANNLKIGDFWFDTNTGEYRMKRCSAITPSVTWDDIGVYMDANGVYAGNITAGQVTAGTFTGITIQTEESGNNRIVITDSDDINFYNSADELVGSLKATTWGSLGGVRMTGMTVAQSGLVFAYNTWIPPTTAQWNKGTLVTAALPYDADVTWTLPAITGTIITTGNLPSLTTLGASTVGANIFGLTNPSAITFLRMNADNSVSALSAADFRTAIGLGTAAVEAATAFATAAQGVTVGSANVSSVYASKTNGGATDDQLKTLPMTINSKTYYVLIDEWV